MRKRGTERERERERERRREREMAAELRQEKEICNLQREGERDSACVA